MSYGHADRLARTVTVRFEKVQQSASRTGKCGACGEPAHRRQTFWQTLSPFNIDKATGQPKTRQQIQVELAADIAAWRRRELRHQRCGEV